MTLIRGVMPRLFARGLGLAFVMLVAVASAQPPVIEIDAESGLPTALDIDNKLAARIAAEVERGLEASMKSAPGRETLRFYGVEIDVQRDGSLTDLLGKRIKRGIYREFSLLNVERYQPSNPYDVISVKRDGAPLRNWFTEGGGSFYQIYMGSKNRYLKTGRWYTYEIFLTYCTGTLFRFTGHFPFALRISWCASRKGSSREILR